MAAASSQRIDYRNDPRAPALILVVAVAVIVRIFLLFTAKATEEDFFITLRYSENLARGHGFVYNTGDRVLGTTTPLYTLFLALLIRFHLDPILGGKLLGIAADALACLAVYRLGNATSHPGAGLSAALCLALLPTNLIWSTKGMEVGIVATCAAWAWALWAERREIPGWTAAALLILLRIDGIALAVVLLIASLLRERRIPWRGLTVFILLLLPWLLFALFYFGSPIPASLQAKLIVYGRNAIGKGPFPRLLEFLFLMSHHAGIFLMTGCLIAFVAGVSGWVGRNRKPETEVPGGVSLLAPATWVLIYYAGMAFSKVFLFGWYFVPPTPIYYLLAMTGWGYALQRLLPKFNSIPWKSDRQILAATCLAALLLATGSVPGVVRDLQGTQSFEDEVRIPIARYLRAHAKPTDTVMLEPIGYIGYYSRIRVLDTVGLISPEVLPLYDGSIAAPHHAIWARFKPKFVLFRAGEWIDLQQEEERRPPAQHFQSDYLLIKTWSDPAFPGSAPSFYLFRKIEPGSITHSVAP